MFNPNIKRVLNSKRSQTTMRSFPQWRLQRLTFPRCRNRSERFYPLWPTGYCVLRGKHLYETVKAELSCGGHTFHASGKSVTHNGWKDFEDAFKRAFKTIEEKHRRKKLPELTEGQTFENMQTKISEHYTTPPKHYTEDSCCLQWRAGAEDMGDNVERKGLGTPATRADIIEKLVKDGFVKREKNRCSPRRTA